MGSVLVLRLLFFPSVLDILLHWILPYSLPLFGDKQFALIGEQIAFPYWGTDFPYLGTNSLLRLGLSESKQTNNICYWGTNNMLLLKDKQVILIEVQTACPNWGTNTFPYWGTNTFPYLGTDNLPLLGDKHLLLLVEKQLSLIRGQITCPYWGTNSSTLLRDKHLALIGRQTTCSCWATAHL